MVEDALSHHGENAETYRVACQLRRTVKSEDYPPALPLSLSFPDSVLHWRFSYISLQYSLLRRLLLLCPPLLPIENSKL